MDECTASNNSSLGEKKTWLVIETSEPQAEKEVQEFGRPAALPPGRPVSAGGVESGRTATGEALAPLCPGWMMWEALGLHDAVVGTLWILHHPKL